MIPYLCERLRALRVKKGLSQREMAQLLGMAKSQYHRCERGEAWPSHEALERLRRLLNAEPGQPLSSLL